MSAVLLLMSQYSCQTRVNNAVNEAFGTGHPLNEIQSESTFTKVSTPEWEVEIACYFTNVDNNGELETVLRAIATQPKEYLIWMQQN